MHIHPAHGPVAVPSRRPNAPVNTDKAVPFNHVINVNKNVPARDFAFVQIGGQFAIYFVPRATHIFPQETHQRPKHISESFFVAVGI
jgi:hypothetical protein